MTSTRKALTALAVALGVVTLSATPADAMRGPSTSDTACKSALPYKLYAHNVAAGTMHPDVWPSLESAGWTVTFPAPTSPVLYAPECGTR